MTLIVSEAMFRNTMVMRPNFKLARWTEVRNDLRDYESCEGNLPTQMYDEFLTMLGEAKNKHIPKCRPKTNKYRLLWMRSPRIRRQRTTQWQCWRKFKRTKSERDYDAYKMERNRLGDMIRSAKMGYERRLIVDMKSNHNLYHGHCL